ncbi:hypothetical protein ADIAG_00654 [Paeniglutamicibacter gangotriensis Lz1y]|uniref:Polysaccharide biosynthesis protein n=2 Tax=Paeniglutamicibacter gangotriensis TaxID=254787 RepID=M7NCK6_9MICC|nr:hypothetical protein ADIAG_00654 [Paeniglutamicibacter gangotriensis Lz1y]
MALQVKRGLSSRYFRAIIVSGLASLAPTIVTLALARSGTLDPLGLFGAMYAVFLLVQQLMRDMFVNAFLAHKPSIVDQRLKAGVVSLAGLVVAGLLLLISMPMQSLHFAVLGACLHGILLGSYFRTLDLSLGNGRSALMQEMAVFCSVLVAGIASVLYGTSGFSVVITWAVSYALVGYISSWKAKLRVVPRWEMTPQESRTGRGFGFQGLVGSGSVHVLTLLLTTVSTAVVGVFRVSSTLLGPANLISSALQPILIGSLSDGNGPRTIAGGAAVDWPRAKVSAVVLPVVVSLVCLALLGVGSFWGALLFPGLWETASPIVAVMFWDVIIVAIGLVPQTIHRITWASRPALLISILSASIRIPAVLIGAVVFGAIGAAYGFLIVTVINTALLWLSCLRLIRNKI